MDAVPKSMPKATHLLQYFRRNIWLVIAGFVLFAASAVVAYTFGRQYLFPSSYTPVDVIYSDSMWAMHGDMHALGGMMGNSSSADAANGSGTPVAEMVERFYDFGSIASGKQVSRSFVLANHGDAPLIVTHAYATCGCTSAEISAAVIPPGKAGLVTVYLTPMRTGGANTSIQRGIILETNDPKQPQIEIWVQATIHQ